MIPHSENTVSPSPRHAATRRAQVAGALFVCASLAGCMGAAPGETDDVVATQSALIAISPFQRTPIAGPVTFSGTRVRALFVRGSRVYVGGTFSFTWNGQTYNNLAAFDLPSSSHGTPTVVAGFRPQPNGAVWALATNGTKIYVGGEFSTLGGAARARLGAVNADTGAVDATFRADVSGNLNCGMWCQSGPPNNGNPGVHALVLSPDGGAIVAGGNFTTIGGTARSGIAAVDGITGGVSTTRFTSGISGGTVSAIRNAFGAMFIGGSFTNYQGHANLVTTDSFGAAGPAVFDTGGNPAFALDVDLANFGQVFAGLGGSGNKVMSFQAFGAGQGSFLWESPVVQGDVQAVVFSSGGVYFGFHDGLFVNGSYPAPGDQYKLAGVPANVSGNPPLYFRANAPGGPCTAANSTGCWAPLMDPPTGSSGFWGVWALAAYGSSGTERLMAGGEFTRVGGISATKLFATFPLVP